MSRRRRYRFEPDGERQGRGRRPAGPALDRRAAAQRDRRELRQLLEKDDRILQDIGLTRVDVESALSRPMGINARREAARLSRIAFYLDGERLGARH